MSAQEKVAQRNLKTQHKPLYTIFTYLYILVDKGRTLNFEKVTEQRKKLSLDGKFQLRLFRVIRDLVID